MSRKLTKVLGGQIFTPFSFDHDPYIWTGFAPEPQSIAPQIVARRTFFSFTPSCDYCSALKYSLAGETLRLLPKTAVPCQKNQESRSLWFGLFLGKEGVTSQFLEGAILSLEERKYVTFFVINI